MEECENDGENEVEVVPYISQVKKLTAHREESSLSSLRSLTARTCVLATLPVDTTLGNKTSLQDLLWRLCQVRQHGRDPG